MGDTYKATQSPGAAVGIANTAAIEGSVINIGASNDERKDLIEGLEQLIAAARNSTLVEETKGDAVRYLENAREELSEGENPNPDVVEKWLVRAKGVLNLAERGTELYDKAKAVLAGFGIAL